MSREYLLAADQAFEAGHVAPARFLAVHALELGVKAALVAATGSVPRTHNVGGEFGRHYRGRVGADVTRRLNRILGDYDGPRYPDWEPPELEALAEELATVRKFLRVTLPRLVGEAAK